MRICRNCGIQTENYFYDDDLYGIFCLPCSDDGHVMSSIRCDEAENLFALTREESSGIAFYGVRTPGGGCLVGYLKDVERVFCEKHGIAQDLDTIIKKLSELHGKDDARLDEFVKRMYF